MKCIHCNIFLNKNPHKPCTANSSKPAVNMQAYELACSSSNLVDIQYMIYMILYDGHMIFTGHSRLKSSKFRG